MAEVEIRIAFEDEEDAVLIEEAAAAEDGVVATRPRGIEPITMIILAGGIAAVAGVFASWLAGRRRKGKRSWGQVVDLRPGVADPIRRDEDLEFGQIMIISPAEDGKTYKVTIEVYDPDNDFTELAKLIFGKLADGVVKPLDTLAQAAKSAVGDKGEVKTEEATAA